MGSLRLGASNTFALTGLPDLLATLELRHPKLHVELTINNSGALSDSLDAGELDVALLVDPPHGRQYAVQPLASYELAWFSCRGPKSNPGILHPRDVCKWRIVTMPPATPFHTLIADWFAQAKVPLPTLDTCNDMATLVRLVQEGVAASVLPVCLISHDLIKPGLVKHRSSPALKPLAIYAACRIKDGGQTASETIVKIARDVMATAGPYVTPLSKTESGTL